MFEPRSLSFFSGTLKLYGNFVHFLQEAVALVTGGASGLGKATVQHLLKHGFKVAMLDLPSSNGSYLAKLINQNCLYVPANVMFSFNQNPQSNIFKL